MSAQSLSVLFVCLGNICRSPSAHGVFRARVADAGLADRVFVDSAGTGNWHAGRPPDTRARVAAAARGVMIEDLRARQVTADDLQRFDYVIAMDAENLQELKRMEHASRQPRAEVRLFGDYSVDHPGQSIPDPYYGGDDGFERVLDRIENASDGLIAEIRERLGSG